MAQVMSKAKTASKGGRGGAEEDAQGSALGASSKKKASASKATTQARKARTGTTEKAQPAKAKAAAAGSSTKARTSKQSGAAKKAPSRAGSKGTSAKKPAAKAAGSTLSKVHARLSRKILDEREKLVRQAEELEAEQQALAADPDAAEMSGDVESGDCVASREREVDLRLSAQIEDTIAQIDRATERLNAGTYGACARCHSRIPAARLEALPYAELCVSCQERHERLYY